MSNEGFKFDGRGKLARIDTFTTKGGKQILTLIFEQGGQYPQVIPIKVFGRLAEEASSWKPGTILEITGRLGGREWQGKCYGEAVAESVEVVGEAQRALPTTGNTASPPPEETDIPF
jgi:single-stranded DNA-binding protein